ncbi:MAG: ribosome maturation factor RimM [Cloacibacillus porcorum]|uniref:ribosome maturation factor RimM n=1 Tax=Cloacibacillus porcorum TaxID=1197717 RepID=UPI0023F47E03|nr:ribosome maturation factor RimM [Cloacibacillus porcorum]MCD7876589.1 ribosome maturation factor RimM [Cloacibacillus porcorum]
MSKKTEGASAGRYEIGKIVGVHGVRGDMLLLPQTDFPERFLGMKELDVTVAGKPMRTFKVRRIEPYEGKNTFFLRLQGVEDRDAAETLKGALITVAEDERVELEEDEYWLDDIIGLAVFDNATGGRLGEVTEVICTGSNDVYVVKPPEGASKAIPAVADVIEKVDVANGTMTVNIPEGLWD